MDSFSQARGLFLPLLGKAHHEHGSEAERFIDQGRRQSDGSPTEVTPSAKA
jgi:hypothetical protein